MNIRKAWPSIASLHSQVSLPLMNSVTVTATKKKQPRWWVVEEVVAVLVAGWLSVVALPTRHLKFCYCYKVVAEHQRRRPTRKRQRRTTKIQKQQTETATKMATAKTKTIAARIAGGRALVMYSPSVSSHGRSPLPWSRIRSLSSDLALARGSFCSTCWEGKAGHTESTGGHPRHSNLRVLHVVHQLREVLGT